MRLALFVAALALVGAGDAAFARKQPPKACKAELGEREAQALVRDCLEADPAAPALCRVETPCEGLREMIAEACRVRPTDKTICRAHRDNDEDEDDEDDDE